ncbi:MAG TPA: sugar transferase [Prevotellaceae bacterium]|nr:sugar transferase [Prevotellaceae bacterium]
MLYRDVYRTIFNKTENVEAKLDAMKPWQRFVKRTCDVVFALMGLILLSPVFLIVYLMLKIQEGGHVIFSQERIGYKGKPFTIYKFRTMEEQAEPDGPQLATAKDSRLTPIGKILREHHLDELPQLWNVLIGDMTMVGPRPERKYFIDKIMKYDSRYQYLYELRPGVTSEATLHNGYTDTMEKMLKRLDRDLYYLENRNLTMDFKIILETATSILFGKKF